MKISIQKKNLIIWAMPILFLTIQISPEYISFYTACVLFLTSIFLKNIRKPIILLALSSLGYFIYKTLSPIISNVTENPMLEPTLERFALIGYIAVFVIWKFSSKTKFVYLGLGNAKNIIQFPLIWRGKKEPIWRFILIFCCICAVPLCVGIFTTKPPLSLLGYGLLFALVNSILEEIIWRGLILQNTVNLIGEKQALLITALAFGIYHLSLGFPLWACLIFSIGGIYMGGAAIISKGLLAPFIMHIFVNLIFVVYGVIL